MKRKYITVLSQTYSHANTIPGSFSIRPCSEVIHYIAREDLIRRVNDTVYMDAYHSAIKQVNYSTRLSGAETSSCDSDIEDSKHNDLLASNGIGQSACLLTNGSHCQEEGEPSDSEE